MRKLFQTGFILLKDLIIILEITQYLQTIVPYLRIFQIKHMAAYLYTVANDDVT